MSPLRIGILGAARIAEQAIVDPAKATGDRLVAVAARDPRRAKEYAARHGVERALGSYAELLADPLLHRARLKKPIGRGALALVDEVAGDHGDDEIALL